MKNFVMKTLITSTTLACMACSAFADGFTPLNFEDNNYKKNEVVKNLENTGNAKMQNAITQLENAQVEVRNELLNVKAKFADVDAKYQNIKNERKSLDKQIKSLENRINKIDKQKDNIRKNMI